MVISGFPNENPYVSADVYPYSEEISMFIVSVRLSLLFVRITFRTPSLFIAANDEQSSVLSLQDLTGQFFKKQILLKQKGFFILFRKIHF